MLVLSPLQRFSVASSPCGSGLSDPVGARGTVQQTPKSRCAWPRRQQAPGCAFAPARGSTIAAPRGDTRLQTPRRLPPEPLLRLGQVPSTPSRWRILPGESAANWEAARGTGNPSQGWGQPRALFYQELFGKSRALPARRPRVHEPSSRAVSAALCTGLPAEGGGGGSRGFLGSFCPEEPALARRGPPEGRGDTATDTCLQGSAPARARRSAPSRSASSRPGGRRRPRLTAGLLLLLLLFATEAGVPAPRGPCLSPLGPESRARGLGRPDASRGRRLAPGDILRPRSDWVIALCAEAPCAPRGLRSATGFSSGLFLAAAAASGHAHPHGHSPNHFCNYREPEYPRRGDVTFPGLPPIRLLPPQRHAWPRCWENSTDVQRKGWNAGWQSDEQRPRLRELEGQGTEERSVSAPTATDWVLLSD